MNKRQIELLLVLNKLTIPSEVRSRRPLDAIQWAIYVAQAMGVNLGYYYVWYSAGPYSTELTADLLAIAGGHLDQQTRWHLDSHTEETIKKLSALLADSKDSEWLHILVCLHYIVTRWRLPLHDVSALRLKLNGLGRYASEDQVRGALDVLVEHGMLT